MPARRDGQIPIPEKAEVTELLDESDSKVRALLYLAVFTGMRSGEIRALTWDHVAERTFEEMLIACR